MVESLKSSRMPGWHRHSTAVRGRNVADWMGVQTDGLQEALQAGGLDLQAAERLVENVVGVYALPFAIAPNFIVNGRELLVPMVIEEPSVVAAAANAARIARSGGGFHVTATEPVMICQIQLFVPDCEKARKQIRDKEAELLSVAAASDQTLVDLGGGPIGLDIRTVADKTGKELFLVLHLRVCVLDAMGANSVNSMGEAMVLHLEKITGGRVGLRILSNLTDQRTVKATVSLPLSALGMRDYPHERVRDGIVSASQFAELDPYRAATHNKGIMNGVDAVIIATGNDWRAVEAGAHAYAAKDGRYSPLCTWRPGQKGSLYGQLEMPMAVGIVGGATQVHPNAQLALKILGVRKATELACIAAAVGMANNLAALRSLATEGIQKGHMRLHKRSRSLIDDSQGQITRKA